MRAMTALVLAASLLSLDSHVAFAAKPGLHAPAPTDVSSRARKRARVYIYRNADERGVIPSYFPSSNAVRDCRATYAQEFRPSGTVIVPRMSCAWRQP